MRYFTHYSDLRLDPDISAYLDEAGHTGYGFLCILLETVSGHMKPGCNPAVTHSVTQWSRLLQCHVNRVRKYLSCLEVNGIVRTRLEGRRIEVEIPILLKMLDKYSRNLPDTYQPIPQQELKQIEKQQQPPRGGFSSKSLKAEKPVVSEAVETPPPPNLETFNPGQLEHLIHPDIDPDDREKIMRMLAATDLNLDMATARELLLVVEEGVTQKTIKKNPISYLGGLLKKVRRGTFTQSNISKKREDIKNQEEAIRLAKEQKAKEEEAKEQAYNAKMDVYAKAVKSLDAATLEEEKLLFLGTFKKGIKLSAFKRQGFESPFGLEMFGKYLIEKRANSLNAVGG